MALFFVLKAVSHPEVFGGRLNNGRQLTHSCHRVRFILPLSGKLSICLTGGLWVKLVSQGRLLGDHKYVTIVGLGFPERFPLTNLSTFSAGQKDLNLAKYNYLFKLTNIFLHNGTANRVLFQQFAVPSNVAFKAEPVTHLHS